MPRRHWRSRLVSLLWYAGVLAVFHLISQLTGFGDWLNETPPAIAAVRVLAVLFFGFVAYVLLLMREVEDGPRRFRDWLYIAFALAMTVANAALLIGGEDTI